MKYISILIILILFPLLSTAQMLKGKVIDEQSGEPVPYVLISSESGVYSSDIEGNFQIDLPAGVSVLLFERIGYGKKKLDLKDRLKDEAGELIVRLEQESVVMGQILIEESAFYSIPQSDAVNDQWRRMSQPIDAGDLLRGISGFALSKRGAYAQEPVFRGFRQEQIQVLFDGFVQYHHACPNRMDPNVTHVVPAEVEKVEIIRGPFSVRFGPSMGPILNYHTGSAVHSGKGLSGTLESGYELNGEGKSGNASLQYQAEKWDLQLTGSIKDYEDYYSGADTLVPAAFQSKDYGIRVGINPTLNQRIQLNWRQSFLRDAKYAGLPMDARSDDSGMASISYQWKNLHPRILAFEVKAFGDQVDHVMDNFDRANFAAVEAVSTVLADTYGGKLEFTVAPAGKHLLFAGMDHKTLLRDGVRDRLVKKNLQTGADLPVAKSFTDKIWQDSRLDNTGWFLEHKFHPGSRLGLTGGIRLDFIQAQINDPEEDFAALYDLTDREELNLSAHLAASYHLNRGLNMHLAIGRGVRSASIDERFINHFAVGKDPYELVGNPELKPEINHQIEWSLNYQSEKMAGSVNLFYSRFSDLITAAVDSSLTRKYSPWLEPKVAKRYVNVEDAYQSGFELSLDYAILKHLSVHGQWSYTYAQNLSWDEPLSRIPPMEASLDVKYERKRWWASATGRFVSAQNRVAASFGEQESEGFQLYHIRMGVKPVKGLLIGLTIENLLDKNYVEFLNWSFNSLIGDGLIYEPGRNISLYARYSF